MNRNERIRKIQSTYWENHASIPPELRDFMSKEEQDFVAEYRKINFTYQKSFPIELDLGSV